MSQGSDAELHRQVIDLINETGGRTIQPGDIWVRRDADGTISYGAVTAAGREALLHYQTYREG